MADSRLRIIFDLLTKDRLSPNLKKARGQAKQLDKAIGKIGPTFKKVGASAKGILDTVFNLRNAIIAAGAAFVTSEIISSALVMEEAVNNLNFALKRSGEFSEEASQGIQDFASELQRTSVVSADVVLGLFSLAKSFGFTAEKAKVATRAALELSSAAGIALEEALRRVGRTISGSIADVSKFAPEIAKLTKEQLRAGEAATILAEKLKGTREAALSPFSKAITSLKLEFGGLLEEFGNLIIKTPEISNAITDLATEFIDLTKRLKESSSRIRSFAEEGISNISKLGTEISNTVTGLIEIAKVVGVITAGLALGAFVANMGTAIATMSAFATSMKVIIGLVFAFNAALIIATTVGIVLFANRLGALIRELNKFKDPLGTLGLLFKILFADITVGLLELIQTGLSKLPGFGKLLSIAIIAPLVDAREKVAKLKKELVDLLGLGDKKVKVKIEAEEEEKIIIAAEIGIGKTFGEGLRSFFGLIDEQGARAASKFEKLFVGGISKGAQGAKALVAGLAGTLADAFLPGIGGPISEIVSLLAEGPEKVKETVRAFTDALPGIFENIIESLPVIFEALAVGLSEAFIRIAERADVIIEAFVEGMIRASPRIAIALALQMPRVGIALAKAMVRVSVKFIDSIVREAPKFIDALIKEVSRFIDALVDEIKGAFEDLFGSGGIFGKILGGGGGFISGAVGVVSGVLGGFGFKHGGVVPAGFPNDTFRAGLTSGEGIIRSDLNARLERFLDTQQGVSGGDMILSQILTELKRPTTATASIQLNERTFGNILLDLSRNNTRIVA